VYPCFKVTLGGADAQREPFVIDAEQFIGVKTAKAKGKRVTNWDVAQIEEIDPREPDPVPDEAAPDDGDDSGDQGNQSGSTEPAPAQEAVKTDGISQEEVLDKLTGQKRLFD